MSFKNILKSRVGRGRGLSFPAYYHNVPYPSEGAFPGYPSKCQQKCLWVLSGGCLKNVKINVPGSPKMSKTCLKDAKGQKPFFCYLFPNLNGAWKMLSFCVAWDHGDRVRSNHVRDHVRLSKISDTK